MDWMTVFMLWTPVSVALLLLFLLVVLVAAILVYFNRVPVVAWFQARLTESSTAHAFNLALTTTSAWLLDMAGALPADQHVPFLLVKAGWLIALALFIKSDAGGNPRLAARAATN